MKKVLLITYYWPPSGGGGVHRWLKMSKYLVNQDLKLYVYTPENPEYPVVDESTLDQVDKDIQIVKRPIIEPYSFYKLFVGKKKNEQMYSGFINKKNSWSQKVSIWIRSNLFIPDARMMWIKPSTKFLKKFIQKEGMDVVISTGPPHSMHVIGLNLRKSIPGLKWIADFRDPWSNIDFSHRLNLSSFADKKNRKLEKEVLKTADKTVAVSWTMGKELEVLGSRSVEVITNGFDHIDFIDKVDINKEFGVFYFGSMNDDRNPTTLWKALHQLSRDDKELYDKMKMTLFGQVDFSVLNDVKKYKLEEKVSILDFVAHKEAISKMKKAPVLFLIVNKSGNASGILTGKVFEYIGAGRPIICLGPETADMKSLLSKVSNAYYIEYGDVDSMIDVLRNLYERYLEGKDTVVKNEYLQFSRQQLANKYFDLIASL